MHGAASGRNGGREAEEEGAERRKEGGGIGDSCSLVMLCVLVFSVANVGVCRIATPKAGGGGDVRGKYTAPTLPVGLLRVRCVRPSWQPHLVLVLF